MHKQVRVFLQILTIALFYVVGAQPASAQLVVTDPTNFVQNISTAVSTGASAVSDATAVTQQITEIANQIKQIEMMTRDLESLSPETLGQLSDAFKKLEDLYGRAEQIGMDYGAIGEQFDDLYKGYDAEAEGVEGFKSRRKKWEKQTDDSVRNAMISHGVINDYGGREADLTKLVEASNSAKGTLAAIQAGNQITAILGKQMMELTKIIVADSRARLSYLQQQQATEQAARKRSKENFMKGFGEMKSYTAPSDELPEIR